MKIRLGPYVDDGEREVSIEIEDFDTWSMNHTLALIILPMLKQLKETKHGSPHTEDVDAPEHLRSTAAPVDDKNGPGDYEGGVSETNIHARWNWIMDEMIWAFDKIVNDDYTEQFTSGVSHMLWKPLDKNGNALGDPVELEDEIFNNDDRVKSWEWVKAPDDTYTIDSEGLRKFENRISNGTRLFGVYFRGLWD